MQPYFLPYAGYFRLFLAADLFIVYDSVQFPRRGWVHRNRLPAANGRLDWLTLPLEKAPQAVLIRDLRFRPSAQVEFRTALRRFISPGEVPAPVRPLLAAMDDFSLPPLAYIVRLLGLTTELLELPLDIRYSSEFGIPESVCGQDRIIALARAVGASHYVNLAGGRLLYEEKTFTDAGLSLMFLSDYAGDRASILSRLLSEPIADVRREIVGNTRMQ